MSQQNEINLKLNVTTNDSSIENAKRRLREIEVAQQSLAKSILDGNGDIDKATAEIDALSKEYLNLNKVLKQTGDSYETLAQEQRRVAEGGDAATAANDRFGRVSNRVALAGDIESNARAIGGAVGAFGGTGAATAVGQGAEIFAVIEAAPRLSAALSGLPATISAAVVALGPVGLAFAAVGAAVAALAFLVQKSTEDMKRATAERLKAEEDLAQSIAGGSTTDAAKEQLAQLERLREEQARLLADAKGERQASFDALREQSVNSVEGVVGSVNPRGREVIGDIGARATELFGGSDNGEIDAAIQRRKETLAQTEAQFNELSSAIQEGAFATNDAIEAERTLANERAQAALAAGSTAATVEQAKIQAEDADAEQLANLKSQTEDRIRVLNAELTALRDSGDTSEQVTGRVSQLEGELGNLNQVLQVYSTTTPKAASATNETTRALNEQAKAQGGLARATRQAGETQNQFLNRQDREERAAANRAGIELSRQQNEERKARSQALKEAIRARRERAQSERESAQKEQADNQDKQAELSRKFQQNEVKAAVDQYRTLEKIRDDALQSEQEAIRSGSIFAIRDIREKASRDLAQSAKDFENQRQDRLVDFRTQFAELLQSINPSAAQGQFSAINNFQAQRAGSPITINANGLDLRQAQTLVQQTIGRTYR